VGATGVPKRKPSLKILAKIVSRIAKMKNQRTAVEFHVSQLSDAYLGTGHL
jgi:hypothetical protein